MKKLVIALAAIGVLPMPAFGLLLDNISPACCIGTKYPSCEDLECTYNGKKRYFTSCGRCSDPYRTLTSLGDNQPCGPNGEAFNSEYGECVLGAIVLPDNCAAGSYGKRGLCTLCPEPGTSAAASTVITDCYVPAGTGGTDTTGKWEYTADCHYSS